MSSWNGGHPSLDMPWQFKPLNARLMSSVASAFFLLIATTYSESPSPQPAIHVSSRFDLSFLALKPTEGGRGTDPILAHSGLSIPVPSQGKTRARDLGICRSTFLYEKWGSRALDSVRRRKMVRTRRVVASSPPKCSKTLYSGFRTFCYPHGCAKHQHLRITNLDRFWTTHWGPNRPKS